MAVAAVMAVVAEILQEVEDDEEEYPNCPRFFAFAFSSSSFGRMM